MIMLEFYKAGSWLLSNIRKGIKKMLYISKWYENSHKIQ